MEYVAFKGFVEDGVKDFGRIVLERGPLRAEGGKTVNRVLNWRIRDLRPGGSHKWLTKNDGELFLKALSYYICGTRLCASKIK